MNFTVILTVFFFYYYYYPLEIQRNIHFGSVWKYFDVHKTERFSKMTFYYSWNAKNGQKRKNEITPQYSYHWQMIQTNTLFVRGIAQTLWKRNKIIIIAWISCSTEYDSVSVDFIVKFLIFIKFYSFVDISIVRELCTWRTAEEMQRTVAPRFFDLTVEICSYRSLWNRVYFLLVLRLNLQSSYHGHGCWQLLIKYRLTVTSTRGLFCPFEKR